MKKIFSIALLFLICPFTLSTSLNNNDFNQNTNIKGIEKEGEINYGDSLKVNESKTFVLDYGNSFPLSTINLQFQSLEVIHNDDDTSSLTYTIQVETINDRSTNNQYNGITYDFYIDNLETGEQYYSTNAHYYIAPGNSHTLTESITVPSDAKICFHEYASAQGYNVYSTTENIYLEGTFEDPTLDSFDIDDSKSTNNSLSLSWAISDDDLLVESIEIFDDSNTLLKDVDKSNLIVNHYLLEGLNSNQTYNLDLKVSWTNPITTESKFTIKSATSYTSSIEPKIDEFALMQLTTTSAILLINYYDPDNVVNSITISDENGNMDNLVISTSELIDNQYEIKDLQTGNYKIDVTLNWKTVSGIKGDTVGQENQSIEFYFEAPLVEPTSVKIIYAGLITLFLLIIVIIVTWIVWFIKKNKSKEIEIK